MWDIPIIVLVIGSGIAALFFLFKYAARQDARDAESREDENSQAR